MESSYVAKENEEKQIEDSNVSWSSNINLLGQPQEAMFFVLAHLPLYELLCMSRVCKSFRDAVNGGDILPWLNIVVEKPLNSRLSDDVLMKMASMADGRITTLALIDCFKITDDGLLSVIAKNPRITKLHIPGCTGITPEGVIKAVQLLTKPNHKLKSLKINGIYNLEKQHLATLSNLLGKNHDKKNPKQMYHKRRMGNNISSIRREDEKHPSIDIDVCPKCNEVRAVFDCNREFCHCRGCVLCIQRCEECGVCVKGGDEEESEAAACGDDLCLGCWIRLPKCSFCNRPYCTQHENDQCRIPECEGFLCVACHDNFVQNSCRVE